MRADLLLDRLRGALSQALDSETDDVIRGACPFFGGFKIVLSPVDCELSATL